MNEQFSTATQAAELMRATHELASRCALIPQYNFMGPDEQRFHFDLEPDAIDPTFHEDMLATSTLQEAETITWELDVVRMLNGRQVYDKLLGPHDTVITLKYEAVRPSTIKEEQRVWYAITPPTPERTIARRLYEPLMCLTPEDLKAMEAALQHGRHSSQAEAFIDKFWKENPSYALTVARWMNDFSSWNPTSSHGNHENKNTSDNYEFMRKVGAEKVTSSVATALCQLLGSLTLQDQRSA